MMTPAKKVLFVIGSDPRLNGRSAEAVRIAAGVSVWKRVRISVYFHGPATLLLNSMPDDLIDGDSVERYLPILSETAEELLVRAEGPETGAGSPTVPVRRISEHDLVRLMSSQDSVVRF